MVATIEFILFLTIIWALLFYNAAPRIWLPIVTICLLGLSSVSAVTLWLVIPSWIIFIAVAIIFNVPVVRIKIITQPIFKLLRRLLPSISKTEQEAIEAGDVWWEKDLMSGRPDWQKLLAMSKPTLTEDEQAFIDNQVEILCGMLNDWRDVYEEKQIPQAVWDYLKQERFLGLIIPKKYGGLAFSHLAHSTIVAKIASRSISSAVNVMVPNSLGPAELLIRYGTEEQKDYYLPRLAKGEEIPCFALTGNEAGSDAGAMTDRGVVCYGQYNNEKVLGIKLSWEKRYITLAPIATVLGLAFKLSDPEHLLGDKEELGITVCLLPTNHTGVEHGNRHLPMNLPFKNGTTRGKDVFIPIEWIIGGQTNAGKGWRMLMECLAEGRGISIPALSTGSSKICYRMTGAYARIRKQFKSSIGSFEGIQEKLAEIGGYTYLIEATRLLTASALSQGIKPAIPSSIAKYHMTEMNRKVVDNTMDIHGGRGIQMGPRNYVAPIYQGVPISITVEGANILTRNLMIFGQGAIRCHPFVREEMMAATESDAKQGLLNFDDLLRQHIGFFISNIARSFALGLFRGGLVRSPIKGPMAKYFRNFSRMSAALALVTDVSFLVLGGQFKRKENLSARHGDILSELYLASAVLKYYQDNGATKEDLAFARWTCKTCLNNIYLAFDSIFVNYPKPWLGRVMRILIFPYGRSYRIPTDLLGHIIAKQMQKPSGFRDRLTKDCYIGKNSDDPTGRLEHAFAKCVAADEANKKIDRAIKEGVLTIEKNAKQSVRLKEAVAKEVVTHEEAERIREYEALRHDVILVDEFAPEYFANNNEFNKS